jgi:hypothetical protein
MCLLWETACQVAVVAPENRARALSAARAIRSRAEESLLESVLQTGRDIFRRFEVV